MRQVDAPGGCARWMRQVDVNGFARARRTVALALRGRKEKTLALCDAVRDVRRFGTDAEA